MAEESNFSPSLHIMANNSTAALSTREKSTARSEENQSFCVHIEVLLLPAVRQILLCSRYPFENLIMKIIPTPARGFFFCIQINSIHMIVIVLLCTTDMQTQWGGVGPFYFFEICLRKMFNMFSCLPKKIRILLSKIQFPWEFSLFVLFIVLRHTQIFMRCEKFDYRKQRKPFSKYTVILFLWSTQLVQTFHIRICTTYYCAHTHTTHCILAVCVVFYSLNDASITTCGWKLYYSFLQENDFNRKSNNEIMCNSQGTCDCVFRNNYASLTETFRRDSTSSLLQDC